MTDHSDRKEAAQAFAPNAELDAALRELGLQRSQFHLPDFSAPIDPQRRLASIPKDATVKGMFFDPLVREPRLRTRCRERYTAFRNYPMREYAELLVSYAQARYPSLPLREGLRRTGWEAFPAMKASIAGSVLFAVAGRDLRAALKATPKAYEHSISPGRVESHECPGSAVVLRFHEIHTFADCYQVGAIEGGARLFEDGVRVEIHVRSELGVDLLVRW